MRARQRNVEIDVFGRILDRGQDALLLCQCLDLAVDPLDHRSLLASLLLPEFHAVFKIRQRGIDTIQGYAIRFRQCRERKQADEFRRRQAFETRTGDQLEDVQEEPFIKALGMLSISGAPGIE